MNHLWIQTVLYLVPSSASSIISYGDEAEEQNSKRLISCEARRDVLAEDGLAALASTKIRIV
jgi:hypothetical protein